MFSSLFILILLLINFNQILSVQIGKIAYSSIKSNSLIYQSSNINCTDCLCDCFNPSLSCLGINCFPLNQACQLIEQQSWILQSDILVDMNSNNFIAIKENNSRLCSCYTPEKILDLYEQNNLTNYATTIGIMSIKYISNDDSLIVLNISCIRKLSAKNLSNILRSLSLAPSPAAAALSILQNDSKIYIAFGNQSINMYDLNLTLLQTSTSWSNEAGHFEGMFLMNNQILIVDILKTVVWSINSLNQNNLTRFFNFSSYNISSPNGLFIYQDELLYISSFSKNLYLFNLNNFTLKQIISSPNVAMNYMSYDSNCNRLWFGSENYTYAPVLDLALNQMNIYQTNGIISQSGIYSMDFDSNYTVFYVDTNGNLRQINIPNIKC